MKRALAMLTTAALVGPSSALADPCGMVPPISIGDDTGPPIRRIGLQKTYMFFADGVETIALRPGFSGDVDNFGMLIPFPSPPAIRKIPDEIFSHVAYAAEPPEILVDLRPRPRSRMRSMADVDAPTAAKSAEAPLRFDEVKVLRQEAIGMYEVAVLEAGSARALQLWMDQHGYRYPKGMDDAANDYVALRWCFVAVKTRVGNKAGVTPRAGMRKAQPQLPKGASFDGHVQAMAFRFLTETPVIPMRLSTFNAGELRNVVYLLTDRPQKITGLPSSFVKRQINGRELFDNLTGPRPIRILGGTVHQLVEQQSWRNWAQERDPTPYVSMARDLFASDVLAAAERQLSHPHEELEKALLDIGEHLMLRGPAHDGLLAQRVQQDQATALKGMLPKLKRLTLSIVDGDFPREHLAKNNLTLARYSMPKRENNRVAYDPPQHGPNAVNYGGIVHRGPLPEARPPQKPRPGGRPR